MRSDDAAAMLPLRPDGPPDGQVTDATGTTWSGAAEALKIGVLGLCGCGYEVENDLVTLLEDPQTPAERLLDGPVYREVLLHLLNDAELLEHGTSVAYCWRTALGDQWLAAVTAPDPS